MVDEELIGIAGSGCPFRTLRVNKDPLHIKYLIEICEAINQGKQYESIFEKIDEPIKEYFYYYVWEYKGKLRGVHKNFGKLSFFGSDKLKKIYHSNEKEKISI